MFKGNKIRQARLSKLLTLDDIYVRSERKLHQARLSLLERGIFLPNERDKKILSEILEIPIGELFSLSQRGD